MNETEQTNKIKILEELQKNGRASASVIAEKIGLSRQTVTKIIRNMEKNKEIWGYSTIFDTELKGVQKFIIFQKRSKIPFSKEDLEELGKTQMESMKKNLGITAICTYYLHGEYDWMTIFTAKDILQAKNFLRDISNRFPGTVEVNISQVLFTLREQYILNPEPMKMKDFL